MSDSPMAGGRAGAVESPVTLSRTRSGSNTVRPQPVTEQSLMESVAGFINEVQALHQPGQDPKCQVTWARFETADINDPSLYCEVSDMTGGAMPLLLVLGYNNGVQIWLIPGSGEAKLVMSRFHGQVKSLRMLPSPECDQYAVDHYSNARPLIALCDTSGPGSAFMSVSFLSLKTGELVHNIKFSSEVADICVNKRVVCVSFRERVAVFDSRTLREKVSLASCYPSPGVHTNPLALHDRWLAFADKSLCISRKSAGGVEGGPSQSVTAWGINVGSKLASGVTKICSNIFSGSPHHHGQVEAVQETADTGVVTVLDIMELVTSEERDKESVDLNNSRLEATAVVAHFLAHTKAIVALQWDHSGSLLLTADRPGHNFHLFRVVAHPLGSAFSSVHHLYTLYRGDTPGSVQDIAFSPDSRWVAVSTLRGTTHIFPISPYGGPVGVRTHTSPRVVNKLSRFHRSAGLNEGPPPSSSGRNSPAPALGSTPTDKVFDFPPGLFLGSPIAYPSPHLPPYPSPTLIQPVAQLRQPYIVTITSQVNLTGARGRTSHNKRNSVPDDIPIRLAVTFAPSRARMLQGGISYSRPAKKAPDSLYVMANHGQLLEYSLDPVPDPTIPRDKVCESSPIELNIVAFGQWNLGKPTGKDKTELSPPLAATNPLLISKDLFGSQEFWLLASSVVFQSPWAEEETEDRWLSQVEIVTHIGPARRLWMGPQFLFRTFQHLGQKEDELSDLDVTVTTRPHQSEPVQMPGRSPLSSSTKPVFIECGSANSFELSPRFANMAIRGSREAVHADVETELREAMSDTVKEEADGGGKRRLGGCKGGGQGEEGEEEFFCLSTEDVRSTPAITEGPRTRNPSGVSAPRSRHTSTNSLRTVEMVTADTKIFSVAVQQGRSDTSSGKHFVLRDVEGQMVDRPVILNKKLEDNSEDEFHPVLRDNEPESAPPAIEPFDTKKSKKNKKKNKICDQSSQGCSSAEDVESREKYKKKKNRKEKSPEPEPELEQEMVEEMEKLQVSKFKSSDSQELFEEFVKEDISYPDDFSPEKDLVEFSEEEKIVELDEQEDSEKVEFFIRDKSSSVESDLIDSSSAKPNPWLNNFLQKSSNMIEDQIFGAAKKYEDDEDKLEDDEEMLELEKNQSNVETNIAALLEDEDAGEAWQEPETSETQASNLPVILTLESKPPAEPYSSDDDCQFRPAPSKRNKKKQKARAADDEFFQRHHGDSSAADSESEKLSEMEEFGKSEGKSCKDGWSFEIDEEDVNKLLENENIQDASQEVEERTALEDVFRFDSEMTEDEENEKKIVDVSGKNVSVEDLNDALVEETETGVSLRRRKESSDTDNEEFKECPGASGSTNLSSSCPDTTSASESSVSNSPNPRATKSKGKKGKKKKR